MSGEIFQGASEREGLPTDHTVMLSSSQPQPSRLCKGNHQHSLGSPTPLQSQLVHLCTLPVGDTLWMLHNIDTETNIMHLPLTLKLLNLLDRGWMCSQGTKSRGFSALPLSLFYPLTGLCVLGAWFLFFMGTLFPWETAVQWHPGTVSCKPLQEGYPYNPVTESLCSQDLLFFSHSLTFSLPTVTPAPPTHSRIAMLTDKERRIACCSSPCLLAWTSISAPDFIMLLVPKHFGAV